jgi:hypothetical protein
MGDAVMLELIADILYSTPYASMQSDGIQAADFIKILHPTLRAAGLSTQIACCDGSGWEQQRSRLTQIQAAGVEDLLGVVTAHGYSSRPDVPFKSSKRVSSSHDSYTILNC